MAKPDLEPRNWSYRRALIRQRRCGIKSSQVLWESGETGAPVILYEGYTGYPVPVPAQLFPETGYLNQTENNRDKYLGCFR